MISHVNVPIDSHSWVTSQEQLALISTLSRLHRSCTSLRYSINSYYHLVDKWVRPSQIHLLHALGNKITLDYYHGDPSSPVDSFQSNFKRLCSLSPFIHKVRTSNTATLRILQEHSPFSNISLIPIGINTDFFTHVTASSRSHIRDILQLPQDAFIVGSFQKDSDGWPPSSKTSPKLVKGPDIFADTISLLKHLIPNLFVLLVGPNRSYLSLRLEENCVPHRVFSFRHPSCVYSAYHALDLYLISSREEGGPKALMESMASGIPVVSTPVGQSNDLIQHGTNGFLSSNFSPHSLSQLVYEAYNLRFDHRIPDNAQQSVLDYDYRQFDPLWDDFFSN